MEDWRHCQREVRDKLDDISEQVTLLRIEVAELKTERKIIVGMIGIFSGLISVAINLAVEFFLKH